MCVVVFVFGVPCESQKMSTFSSKEVWKQYRRNPILLAEWSVCRFVTFYPSELSVRGAQEDVGDDLSVVLLCFILLSAQEGVGNGLSVVLLRFILQS